MEKKEIFTVDEIIDKVYSFSEDQLSLIAEMMFNMFSMMKNVDEEEITSTPGANLCLVALYMIITSMIMKSDDHFEEIGDVKDNVELIRNLASLTKNQRDQVTLILTKLYSTTNSDIDIENEHTEEDAGDVTSFAEEQRYLVSLMITKILLAIDNGNNDDQLHEAHDYDVIRDVAPLTEEQRHLIAKVTIKNVHENLNNLRYDDNEHEDEARFDWTVLNEDQRFLLYQIIVKMLVMMTNLDTDDI